MKRKRGGYKKGKKKKGRALAVKDEVVVNLVEDEENDDYSDDNENENDYDNEDDVSTKSRMEADIAPSFIDKVNNLENSKPDGLTNASSNSALMGKSVGRVKVKLKTSSKTMESQSDTDRSSTQLGLEKQGVSTGGKMVEDSGNSLGSEAKQMGGAGNVVRKPGSIKIKTSKALSNSGGEGHGAENGNATGIAQYLNLGARDGKKPPYQGSLYSKQELDSALTVIKKVMKMDAAEPFNVPVNPEALGIPDYFDVIDTPMDFGTICNNLEKGDKYANSEEVCKDVQYIWDNCYKYNSKGDYIVDLMKRVKKTFMKYWAAAGLFLEPTAGEGIQGDNTSLPAQGLHKSGQLKHKGKKRRGRRHTFDCLCAICVLKRRKREREESARLASGQISTDGKVTPEFGKEDSSLIGSPRSEDSSSNMGESLDPKVDAEVEKKEMGARMEDGVGQYSSVEKQHGDEVEQDDLVDDDDEANMIDAQEKVKVENAAGQLQVSDISKEDPGQHGAVGNNVELINTHSQVGQADPVQENQENVMFQQDKLKLQEREKRAKFLEYLQFENPMLRSLCGTLFPDSRRTVWSGPHSLVLQPCSARANSIHAAIETIMK